MIRHHHETEKAPVVEKSFAECHDQNGSVEEELCLMSWSRQNLSDRHPIPVSMLVSQYERITSHLCVSVQIGRVSPSTPVGCGSRPFRTETVPVMLPVYYACLSVLRACRRGCTCSSTRDGDLIADYSVPAHSSYFCRFPSVPLTRRATPLRLRVPTRVGPARPLHGPLASFARRVRSAYSIG